MKMKVWLALLASAMMFGLHAAVHGRFVFVEHGGNERGGKKGAIMLTEIKAFVGGKNVAPQGRADMAGAPRNKNRAPVDALIDEREGWEWVEPTNFWAQTTGPAPHWMEIDLFEEMPLERVELWGWNKNLSLKILDKNRKVVWESSVENKMPKPVVSSFVLDQNTSSTNIGAVIERKMTPLDGDHTRALYTKGTDWLDTALRTYARVQCGQASEDIGRQLISDFPEDRKIIAREIYGGDTRPEHLDTIEKWCKRISYRVPKELVGKFRTAVAQKEIKTSKDLLPYLKAIKPDPGTSKARTRMLLHLFDPVALERAIRAYSKKWPAIYNEAELLAEFEKVKPAALEAHRTGKEDDAAAEALDNLYRKIYMKHPHIDFKEILMVRRAKSRKYMGFPANYAGNSSIPLYGYANEIVRAPVFQSPDAKVEEVYETATSDNCAFLGDVKLDYDGKRIIYSSGDKSAPNWGVYETDLARPGVRKRLTPTIADIDYYDPCYLPDGRKLFIATSGFQGVPCVSGSDYVGNLHIMENDGSIRRIVFDQDNNWNPTVLPSGRVMYQRWEYTDSSHYFARVLMTMNPDGSDQQEFYGSNSYWPNCLFNVRAIPGSPSKFVGIVTGHHFNPRAGDLVLFDTAKGRHEADGAVQMIPGYGHPVEPVSKDALVEGHSPFFAHPYPLSDELFIAAARVDEWWSTYAIVIADIYDNIVPIWVDTTGNHLLEPIPIKPTPRPIIAKDRRDTSRKDTSIFVVDVNKGPGLRGVPKGTVKKLRIFQYDYSPRNFGGHYVVGFEGCWDMHLMLGTVDVEEDGSCYFNAPANTPLSVQPLDKDGNALQIMRSWLVGMPGEMLTCIGCHEKQDYATVPTHRPIAMTKKPQEIVPWYGPRRGFSFEREVQQVLDRKCIGCHNPDTKAKTKQGNPIPDFATTRLATNKNDKVRGNFSVSYINLHPYVRRNGPEGDYYVLTPAEFHTGTSELFQLLDKGHYGVTLTAEERDRLATWVDINVPYWGTWPEVMNRPNPRYVANTLDRRVEMGKAYANDDFDARIIVNPYTNRVAFVAPPKREKPKAAPKLERWPIDKRNAKKLWQRARIPVVYDIGNFEKIRFAYIPEGKFVMGSNCETDAERPMHVAEIKKAFRMSEHEITVGQFRQFDPNFDNGVYDMHNKDQVRRGYFVNDEPKFPAIRVSWKQANAYCEWLSKKLGKKCRLPTETEWEWACRAGTATPMNYGGLDTNFSQFENLADTNFVLLAVSGIDPAPMKNPPPLYDYELREKRSDDGVLHLAKVGSYKANAFGLYDMHGNVAEWTSSDWTPAHGAASSNDGRKVVRGGSWYRRPQMSTSSWRVSYPEWMRPFDVGFRVVMEEE